MYEEHLANVQAAYAQRYRMLPYLYSLMRRAHMDGMPVMRPLFLDFPEDAKCWTDENLTFMFGPSVLVANVVEKGAKTRKIYLPAGTSWYDMNDNLRRYEGGQEIELPVDLASIPMFLRGSAIYMTSEDVKHILKDELKTLDFLISAETDVRFSFYDDDGWSKRYENGDYAVTEISVKAGERSVISFARTGAYEETWNRLTLRFVSKEKGAFWASVDGRKLPRFLTKDSYDKAPEGWYYNLSDRTVMLKCDRPQKDKFDIIVSCEKFDLIGMENNGAA